VFERKQIALSIGDRIRFTKNVKRRGQKFFNNELRTVIGIDEGRIIFDKGEMLRNGSALHIDQGIAVTSHASQAKTVDQVIVSVPVRSFSQANEAQFYVSMSRGRCGMLIFTDSKVVLREAVTRRSRGADSTFEAPENRIRPINGRGPARGDCPGLREEDLTCSPGFSLRSAAAIDRRSG
jgi:hypothetical protein